MRYNVQARGAMSARRSAMMAPRLAPRRAMAARRAMVASRRPAARRPVPIGMARGRAPTGRRPF